MTQEETRALVLEWIRLERAGHADVKYGDGTPSNDTVASAVERGDWAECAAFIGNYLKRAELFGFDTPQGLQALGKAGVTVIAYMERTLEAHDVLLPKPGVPSGELQGWAHAD